MEINKGDFNFSENNTDNAGKSVRGGTVNSPEGSPPRRRTVASASNIINDTSGRCVFP